ncbi:hypothetical protein C8F01DRAFT_1112168, partial [Mycena amicta]
MIKIAVNIDFFLSFLFSSCLPFFGFGCVPAICRTALAVSFDLDSFILPVFHFHFFFFTIPPSSCISFQSLLTR